MSVVEKIQQNVVKNIFIIFLKFFSCLRTYYGLELIEIQKKKINEFFIKMLLEFSICWRWKLEKRLILDYSYYLSHPFLCDLL